MSQVKRIYARGSGDVWLFVGPLLWSRLSNEDRDLLLNGVEEVARAREAAGASARVHTLPPVEVVAEIWPNHQDRASTDGFISGRASPLRYKGSHWMGVQLPATTAIWDDVDALRNVLIHEFLHCFKIMTDLVDDAAAGRTYRDLSGDPFDAEFDDALLAPPGDWFIGETEATILRHSNAERTNTAVSKAFRRLINVLPVRFPDQGYTMHGMDIPGDVIAHIQQLKQAAGLSAPPSAS